MLSVATRRRLLALLYGATPRRLINIAKARLALKTGRTEISHYPITLDLVLTKACNLRCVFCVSYTTVSGGHHLPVETLRKVADGLFPHVAKLSLCSGGEPFLYIHMREVLDSAKRNRLPVQVTTNGMLIDEEKVRWIVDEGLVQFLHLSFDAATPETLERIRVGAKFDKIEKNMARLIERKAETGSIFPEITVRFAAMKSNIHELPDAVRLAARKFGAVAMMVNPVTVANDMDRDESLTHHVDMAQKYFEEARKVAREEGITLELSELDQSAAPKSAGRCDYPTQFLQVDADGFMRHCYKAWFQSLGSVNDGIDKIWFGSDYAKLRATCNSEKPFFPYCAVCPERLGAATPQAHDQAMFADLYTIPELAHLSGQLNDRKEENFAALKTMKAEKRALQEQ